MERGIYSIGAVAKMVGVSTATLRAWEERYGVIRPPRSRGGQRLYSRDDVDRLLFVAERIESGMTPADAHRLLEESGGGGAVASGGGDGGILVLVAERDPFAADLAEYFLRTEGFIVLVTFDAPSAGRIALAERPEVVVVDLLISGGMGMEVCRMIAGADIPVIAISTLQTREAALDAGASAFLQKPVEPLVLVSTVKDLLGRSAFLRRGARVR